MPDSVNLMSGPMAATKNNDGTYTLNVSGLGGGIGGGDASAANQTTQINNFGNKATTVANDGDLQTIDTDSEIVALDPTANTAGAANTSFSFMFLVRWLIGLTRFQTMRIGARTTTPANDGDLQTIDTEAEATSTNPAANSTGTATTPYSITFLLRWTVDLLQILYNRFLAGTFTFIISSATKGSSTAAGVTSTTAGTNKQYLDVCINTTAFGQNAQIRTGGDNGDGESVAANATRLEVKSLGYLLNGSTADRIRSIAGAASDVGVAASAPFPAASINATATYGRNSASGNSHVASAAPCNLFEVSGYAPTAGFIQIHNTASTPAGGAVPLVSFAVGATSNFVRSFAYPLRFTTGCTIVHSSTQATYTAGSTTWIEALTK